MKLYNKKRAANGWWRVGMGILLIVLTVQERENWINWVAAGLFLFGGIWDLVRARTKKMTEEERIEATDERNQMILLQTKSRTYDIMNVMYMVIMIAFLMIGQMFDMHQAWTLAAGIGFVYAISGVINSIVSIYYNEI